MTPPPASTAQQSPISVSRSSERPLPRVTSRDLLRGTHLLAIDHGTERYFLRMTRNNKLILTK